MKLKSVKCMICNAWHGAFRTHCPHCGATPCGLIHYNTVTHKRIVSGFRMMPHARKQLLAIARELAQ